MALFEVPKRATKAQDHSVAKKSKTATKKTSVRGGNSLLGKITEIQAVVEKNLGQFKGKYAIETDVDMLRGYITRACQNGVIAIDTETTGLDPISDKIVGLCVYTPDMLPAYVPINHVSYITGVRAENQLTEEQVAKELQELDDSDVKIIMFNAKFDIRVIRNQLGVYLTCYWDCYLAGRLLNENEPSKGLKALHKKYILKDKEDAFSFDTLFHGVSFDNIPIKTAYLYAAHDAIITYELYEFQKKHLREDHERQDMRGVYSVFRDIEMPCVNVVCDMEDNGVAFDLQYAQELSDKYNALLEEKKQAFYEICDEYADDITQYKIKNPNHKLGDPINIGSATQLAVLLYDVLKTDQVDQKQPRGTGVQILQKIDTPLTKAILEYREISKLLNTYIEKLPECVNEKDGRIHCSFNQYGADTGRFSSSEPNLQNIPSRNHDIRKMFTASPGYVLMSSDYSQQEPKIMTQMCGDEKMIQAYKEGKDLYAEIASLAFNKDYEDCLEFRPDGTTNKEGKGRRSQAKTILLGVLYGRGVPSIAEQLGTTIEKAQRIKDSVFKGFPAIPQFEEDSLIMGEELGYVTTLWGRKRRLPDLQLQEYEFRWKDGAPPDDDLLDFACEEESDRGDNSAEVPEDRQNYYERKLRSVKFTQKRRVFEEANEEGIWIVDNGGKIADAERQCVNARIQGSAADMSKLAMILVNEDQKLRELGFRLLIPVHDELIGECPEENAKEASERFAQLMSQAAESKLDIPIKCDVAITRAWYGDELSIN